MTETQSLRAQARCLFDAAVRAADPAQAVTRALESTPLPVPDPGGTTYLIAVGKAAPAMLRAAQRACPEAAVALAVTHHENDATLPGAVVLRAGHPVPDAAGAEAARRVIAVLSQATSKDRVVAFISGGGSALLPAPPDGVSLHDKAQLNSLLLGSGCPITEINLIRQQVSRLKGGGFLRFAAPAPVQAYLLSDVIGDDLRAIASGPTVNPIGTASEARALLIDTGLWDHVPQAIRAHLEAASAEGQSATPVPPATNILVGSNRLSLKAMAAEGQRLGLKTRIVSDSLTGDVSAAAGQVIAQITAQSAPTALLFGGETTVVLSGDGRGGRNQELALRVAADAPEIAGRWVFLSGGTDGRDGPTDAAGGLVDAGTPSRITAAGHDLSRLLANNDSYTALAAAGDLLMTGATGTNVADVQVLLIAP